MKAVLYAVVDGKGMSWDVSLDIRADFAYWFGQQRNPARILMLDPSISFGQAIVMRDRLKKLTWDGASDREILKRAIAVAEDMIGQRDSQGRVSSRKLQLLECHREQAEAYQRAYGANRSIIEEYELERLAVMMHGRSLLLDEVHQLMAEHELTRAAAEPLIYLQSGYLRGMWQFHQGIHQQKRGKLSYLRKGLSYTCHRCGGGAEHMVMTECMFCGTSCPYCEQCLTMGRSRYCSVTVTTPTVQPQSNQSSNPYKMATERNEALKTYIEPWGLSVIQAEASGKALEFMKGVELHNRNKSGRLNHQFLIWAVTGAGKTEMIFPMIHYMTARGGKVVIATPRRDVVLELKPRIEKAFSSSSVVTLYGGSSGRWSSGEITIATTHQLMRFEEAFDLVIIDELDAFPYHNNPMLEYAARKVCKQGGMTILLSATPPRHLQKAAKRGHLPHVKVTARYHRHPLPVPKLIPMPSLKKQLQTVSLDRRIASIIQASIDRGAQLFVFVPKIYMVEPLTKLLSRVFPDVITRGTSSKDEERAQKVIDFRGKGTRILVTTTILERGVTIPKSDVLILDADEPIFDSAALVQMSGRAGRSADDPAGHVYFAAKEKTRAQVEAVGQIKEMNRLARKKGYLIEKGRESHGSNI